MTIDENLMCSFQVLKPDENKGQNNANNANANAGGRPGTPNKKVTINLIIIIFGFVLFSLLIEL